MIYIVIGVSGSGKTSIGSMLADYLAIPFYDADDFHSDSNIKKLNSGIALTDEDRLPWLIELGEKIKEWDKQSDAVLACSALKESYRGILKTLPQSSITWIFLRADKPTIAERLANRKNHFFNPELLASQFETLEIPSYGVHIDVINDLETIVRDLRSKIMGKAQIGLVGIGVMGKSLARNIAGQGFKLSVYNRHLVGKEEDVAKDFVETYPELPLKGFDNIDEFILSLASPRIIMLMVNAGTAVDLVLEQIGAKLDEGDIIIDAGNSLYSETAIREDRLAEKKIRFFGLGVSGGEEGALKGPSLMPGGDANSYYLLEPILSAIAAKDRNGKPCCSYIGPGGAGHFTKMVHNGLEYAEMQLLAEAYFVLRYHAGMSIEEVRAELIRWKQSEINSYLLDITIDILAVREGGEPLLDLILDKASNKGTGGWTIEAGTKLGLPLSTISEALMARFLSSKKNQRVLAAELYHSENSRSFKLDKTDTMNAYKMARMINHAIGFDMLFEASKEYQWDLDLNEIARVWTNGCIIRSGLMERISELNSLNRNNLLLVPEFAQKLLELKPKLIDFVSCALMSEAPVPVFSAALNYFLQFRTMNSSANLIQAQRDYFGAHTYQRIGEDNDAYHHTDWQKLQ